MTLFPETKTDEYAFPSDVVCPVNDEAAGEDDDSDVMSDGGTFDGGISEGEEEEEGGEERDTVEEVEWKSALPHGGWTETLQRFRDMVGRVTFCLFCLFFLVVCYRAFFCFCNRLW